MIVAAEYQQLQIPLTDVFVNGKLALYPEVIGKKYFNVYLKQDSLVFQAGGYVGLIPINDRIILDIRPRVPVHNLERILQVTNQVPVTLDLHLREYATHKDPSPSLIDILARSLINAIGEIELYGLHREYAQRRADTSFPRGRILMGATFERHMARGRSHAVTASWFEQSSDTAPNRCLKYAIWLLAQRYVMITPRKGQRGIVIELNRLYNLFGKTRLDKSKRFLKDSLVSDPNRLPPLRSYYAQALYIATTIIENRGVDFDRKGGDVLLPSMIFDFDVVFENYLRAVLQEQFSVLAPYLRVLDGNLGGTSGGAKLLFDTSTLKEKANPDIVIRQDNADKEALYPIIIDAKYKPVENPDRSDINQAIGYGLSYGCHNVVLAHPRREGGAVGLRLIGTIKGFNFYQYIFDLANKNPQEEESKFAKEILSLAIDEVSADL